MELKQATSDKSKRLVDAMKIVTRLSKRISVLILLGGTPAEVYDEVLKVIAEAPTEDAAPVVHGQWIPVPSSDMMTGKAYKCSQCGKMRYGSFMPNYCGICGAKMEKCEKATPKSEEECD